MLLKFLSIDLMCFFLYKVNISVEINTTLNCETVGTKPLQGFNN